MAVIKLIREFAEDVRYGARMLVKSPTFTIVAVVALALGIGVNTAMFSLVNSVLLRGLTSEDANRLVVVAGKTRNSSQFVDFSYPDFVDYQNQSGSAFSDMLAYTTDFSGFAVGGQAQEVVSTYVSNNFFSMLGVRQELGQVIQSRPESNASSPNQVAVLSHSYWRRAFNADPSIIGKTALLDGTAVTIIGIAAPEFRGPNAFINADVYVPLTQMVLEQKCACAVSRGPGSLRVIGRLRPGVTRKQAAAVLNVISQRLAKQYPETDKGITYEVIREPLARPQPDAAAYWPIVLSLAMGLAAVVLLLACTNVINLLLVRSNVRQGEMAVRAALGAGRMRLTRQLIAENLLLALLGGSAGILLGLGVSKYLGSMSRPVDFPMFHLDLDFDWRVFLFALLLTIFLGIIMGLFTARRAARLDLNLLLHEGYTVTHSRSTSRHRNVLVVLQMAGSTVLLITAGLFSLSLKNAQKMDLGFDPHQVLNLTIDIKEAGYDAQAGKAFYQQLLNQVSTLPGVESAAYAYSVPFGGSYSSSEVHVEGQVIARGQPIPVAIRNDVTTDYFRTMKVPLLKGRVFRDSDDDKAPGVAIINQTMAQRFWPGQDPIGKRFKRSSSAQTSLEIAGIVGNVRYLNPVSGAKPYFYIPMAQNYDSKRTLHVRSSLPPEALSHEVIGVMHAIAPTLPVSAVITMDQQLQGLNGFYLFRINADSSGTLGMLGLVLAVIGVYGVVSYATSRRSHEVGLRMALGARRGQILGLFLLQGTKLIGIGVASGIVLSLPLARLVSHLLPSVSATDPLVFGVALALVGGSALLACYLPAYRATRLEPMVVLHHE